MIKIQNIYYMLAYAYKTIHHTEIQKRAYEDFEYADDLLADMLVDSLKRLMKFGIDTNYLSIEESRYSIKGKVNINGTLKSMPYNPRKICCLYDEYSCNTYINKIVKSTCIFLIKSSQVKDEYKKRLKNMMFIFQDVDKIDVRHIDWRKVCFNRNNNLNALIVNLCYMLINGMLISDKKGSRLLRQFEDDDYMCNLYERFILSYYKKHFPDLKVDKKKPKWNTKDEDGAFLPEMRSDTMIHYKKHTLIIDAKFYKNIYRKNRFAKKTFHSANLYQIYSYVKNWDALHEGVVSGMLLYANTDEVVPDVSCDIDGNKFYIRTLDLNVDFENIQKQLTGIVKEWKDSIDAKAS